MNAPTRNCSSCGRPHQGQVYQVTSYRFEADTSAGYTRLTLSRGCQLQLWVCEECHAQLQKVVNAAVAKLHRDGDQGGAQEGG